MVPGSTLMYGSSLRIETLRPRALSRRPALAAVMPLPREEVTPPVTKTYLAMGRVLRGFFQCYRIEGPGTTGISCAGDARHDPRPCLPGARPCPPDPRPCPPGARPCPP